MILVERRSDLNIIIDNLYSEISKYKINTKRYLSHNEIKMIEDIYLSTITIWITDFEYDTLINNFKEYTEKDENDMINSIIDFITLIRNLNIKIENKL